MEMNWVVVSSTAGSVMNELFGNPYFRRSVTAVVSDRDCAAIEKARLQGVPTHVIRERENTAFSSRLLDFLQEVNADFVISFFTRLFTAPLLSAFRHRIINVHPSLLPSFKGLDGFGDTLRAGVRYVGSTIHFIDERMDEGNVILQSVYPLDPGLPAHELRHRIFDQQCRGVLQVVRWIEDGRVEIAGNRVCVKNAAYVDLEFSPNLDFEDAIDFGVLRH